jgi:hypothetical protein
MARIYKTRAMTCAESGALYHSESEGISLLLKIDYFLWVVKK